MNKRERNKELLNKGFLDNETFDFLDEELANEIQAERINREHKMELLKIELALLKQNLLFT